METRLAPTVMTAGSNCHRCSSPVATGDLAWQATAGQDNRGCLCLACARPLATGRPGASAELEAMRRMRTEPIVKPARPAPPRIAVRTAAPGQARTSPVALRPGRSTAPNVRRWRKRLALSFLTVFVTAPLTAAGPVGQVLAALIGFPAVALFWVSVIGLPVAVIRTRWSSRREPALDRQPARSSTLAAAAATPRPGASMGGQARVAGAEDNWVKGVRGEQAVGAALDSTGLSVLHDRRLRAGSAANIDHLIVAADAVYVVDAKNLAGSLTTTGDQLRVGGRDRGKLLDGVQRQAEEVAAALSRLGVTAPVRPVLCLTGAARPAGIQLASGVLLTTPETVAPMVTLPGLLDIDDRARIADLLAWAFPPAVERAMPVISLGAPEVGVLPSAS
ncbi:nuclease-related domain-containing protein [Modestobacter sp. VKM Ac-2982]|nr:nuclease-related domain-containing protein [Modestobacter sp. VKM Ac-2981]MCZ2827154.1 nuclease-related domain-containing protein [Modestobacter sp. VKM Ac-2981]MCZ2854405.1 nuclease-related domain-containing protein [Modestobacter sp. VKM Ac-2982]